MRLLQAERPGLPVTCFVQMGDFLRYALDECVAQGIRQVVLGVMVGNLTKIAQGETITHANRNVVDTELVARVARRIGASAADCQAIAEAKTARFGADLLTARGLGAAFHAALAQEAIATLTAPERYGRAFELRVLVSDPTLSRFEICHLKLCIFHLLNLRNTSQKSCHEFVHQYV